MHKNSKINLPRQMLLAPYSGHLKSGPYIHMESLYFVPTELFRRGEAGGAGHQDVAAIVDADGDRKRAWVQVGSTR